jgi:hypothetical protein
MHNWSKYNFGEFMKKSKTAIIKAELLKKLRRRGNWGNSHTAFDDLPRGFPKDLRGSVKEIADELVKEGLLQDKPTGYGRHVSLNPQRKAEIDRIIEEVLD